MIFLPDSFNDDADSNGRGPAPPWPARYVIPMAGGFKMDGSKPVEMDDDDGPRAHGGGGEGAGEEDARDPIVSKCGVVWCSVVGWV